MVSMMNSSILDADVKELCIHVMKKLIERTQNDEAKSISKNAVDKIGKLDIFLFNT